jgi:hypothetical protein
VIGKERLADGKRIIALEDKGVSAVRQIQDIWLDIGNTGKRNDSERGNFLDLFANFRFENVKGARRE